MREPGNIKQANVVSSHFAVQLLSADLTECAVNPSSLQNTSFLWLRFKWLWPQLPCILGVLQVYLYKMQSFCVHRQVLSSSQLHF